MSNSRLLKPIPKPIEEKTSALSEARIPFLVPGNHLEAYIQAVKRIPLLTAQEEYDLAVSYCTEDNLNAARRLVLSHLRFVVSIARTYLGYGLPHADLIQEGNIGLMKAVKRFDPKQKVRLVSYAIYWIKAEIHDYILRNWRIMKVATTKAQRKLFFNLRSHKKNGQALSSRQIDELAKSLDVKKEEIAAMEVRLSTHDLSLEGSAASEDEEFAPISYLVDSQAEPSEVLACRQQKCLQSDGLADALAKLDMRSREIIEARWLPEHQGKDWCATLQELAEKFSISAERVRQIEAAAMKKMKVVLQNYCLA